MKKTFIYLAVIAVYAFSTHDAKAQEKKNTGAGNVPLKEYTTNIYGTEAERKRDKAEYERSRQKVAEENRRMQENAKRGMQPVKATPAPKRGKNEPVPVKPM